MSNKKHVNTYIEKIKYMQRRGIDDPGIILQSLLTEYCAANKKIRFFSNPSQPYIDITNEFFSWQATIPLNARIQKVDEALCDLVKYNQKDQYDSLWAAFFYFYPMTFNPAGKEIKGMESKEKQQDQKQQQEQSQQLPESILKKCWILANTMHKNKEKKYFNELLNAVNSPDPVICKKAIEILRRVRIPDTKLRADLLSVLKNKIEPELLEHYRRTYDPYAGSGSLIRKEEIFVDIIMLFNKFQIEMRDDLALAAINLLLRRVLNRTVSIDNSTDKRIPDVETKNLFKIAIAYPALLNQVITGLISIVRSERYLSSKAMANLNLEHPKIFDQIFESFLAVLNEHVSSSNPNEFRAYTPLLSINAVLKSIEITNPELQKKYIVFCVQGLNSNKCNPYDHQLLVGLLANIRTQGKDLQRLAILTLLETYKSGPYVHRGLVLLINSIQDPVFKEEILQILRSNAVNPINPMQMKAANALLCDLNVDVPNLSREIVHLVMRAIDSPDVTEPEKLIGAFCFMKIEDSELMRDIVNYLIEKTRNPIGKIRNSAMLTLSKLKLTDETQVVILFKALIANLKDAKEEETSATISYIVKTAKLNSMYSHVIATTIKNQSSDFNGSAKLNAEAVYKAITTPEDDLDAKLTKWELLVKSGKTGDFGDFSSVLTEIRQIKTNDINLMTRVVDLLTQISKKPDFYKILSLACEAILSLQVNDTVLQNKLIELLINHYNRHNKNSTAFNEIVATLGALNLKDNALKQQTIIFLLTHFSTKLPIHSYSEIVYALISLASDPESKKFIFDKLLRSIQQLDYDSVRLNYIFKVLERIAPTLDQKEKINLTAQLEAELKSLPPASELKVFMIGLINKLESAIAKDRLLFRRGIPTEIIEHIARLRPQ